MAGTYDLGNVVRSIATFGDAAGGALDPTTVTFRMRSPTGTLTTYVYGINAELVRMATGLYRVDLSLSEPGRWSYRWLSTGTGQAAKRDHVIINAADADGL